MSIKPARYINHFLTVCFLSTWMSITHPMDAPGTPDDDDIDIHAAVDRNDYNVITRYFKQGNDINVPDKSGVRPIERALKNGNFALANYLLFHGAIVEPYVINFDLLAYDPTLAEMCETILNENPLSKLEHGKLRGGGDYALTLAISQARVKAVAAILSNKDNTFEDMPQHITRVNRFLRSRTYTPSQLARYRQIHTLLTGIFSAAKYNDSDSINKYIEDGRDVNAKDERGNTLLEIALDANNFKIAQLLLLNGAYADNKELNIRQLFGIRDTSQNRSVLVAQAIFDSDHELVSRMIKINEHLHDFALRLSISQGRVTVVAQLLALQVLPPAVLGDYLSLAHRILNCTQPTLARHAHYQAIIDLLIAHGSRSPLNPLDQRIETLLNLLDNSEHFGDFLSNKPHFND